MGVCRSAGPAVSLAAALLNALQLVTLRAVPE